MGNWDDVSTEDIEIKIGQKEGDYTRKKVIRVMTSSSTSVRRQTVRLGQLSSGVKARCDGTMGCTVDMFASQSGHASRLEREGRFCWTTSETREIDHDLALLGVPEVLGYSGKSRA